MLRTLVLVTAVVSMGCGASAFDTARVTVAAGAKLVAGTDAVLARGYREHAARSYDAASTAAEYRERMTEWDTVESAQHVAIEALHTAEASVDAAEAADNEAGLMPVLGCVAEAVRHLIDGMREVGVPISDALTSFAHALSRYTTCGQEIR